MARCARPTYTWDGQLDEGARLTIFARSASPDGTRVGLTIAITRAKAQ